MPTLSSPAAPYDRLPWQAALPDAAGVWLFRSGRTALPRAVCVYSGSGKGLGAVEALGAEGMLLTEWRAGEWCSLALVAERYNVAPEPARAGPVLEAADLTPSYE